MTFTPAPIGRRFGAYFLDGLFLWAIFLVPFLMYMSFINAKAKEGDLGAITSAYAVFTIFIIGVSCFYWTTKGSERGSFGYARTGIRLVDIRTGLPVGRRRAVGRMVLLSIIPFAVLSPFLDPRHRGWHDMAMSTLVVDARTPGTGVGGGTSRLVAAPAEPVQESITWVTAEPATDRSPVAEAPAPPAPPAVAPEAPPSAGIISVVPGAAPSASGESHPAQGPRITVGPAPQAVASEARVQTQPPVSRAPAPPPPPAPPAADEDEDDLDATRVAKRPAVATTALVWDNGTITRLTGHTRIGRDPGEQGRGVAVSIPDSSKSLSKTHCTVEPTNTGVLVTDSHSTNGTRIERPDGTETQVMDQPAVLARPGDRLVMGDRSCTVEVTS